jgi:hypothetical protein
LASTTQTSSIAPNCPASHCDELGVNPIGREFSPSAGIAD